MMLWLAQPLERTRSMVHGGNWLDRMTRSSPTTSSSKNVLIIGFGRIGTRTAKRCEAMDMKVMIYDPYVDQAKIAEAGYEAVSDLDAALEQRRLRLHPLPQERRKLSACSTRPACPDETDRLPRQHRPRRHHRRSRPLRRPRRQENRRRRPRRLRRRTVNLENPFSTSTT